VTGDRGDDGRGTPTVTVVIATYHRPEPLRVAIRAVLAQDYGGPIEVIVVHDRTDPDGSLVELAEGDFAGPRTIRVCRNDHTPGLAGARNTGILAATGEWVGFCDDDDEWRPRKLSTQFRALAQRPADVCVSGITVVYGDHRTDRIPDEAELTPAGLAERRVTAAHPSTVLVRRSTLIDEIGLVDEEIPGSYGEDYDWLIRAVRNGPVTVAPEPLVIVHWGQSLFSDRWQTIIDALDYLVAKHPEFAGSRAGQAQLTGRRAFCEAALGRRADAVRDAARSIRLRWREPRGYLALLVASRLVSAPRLMDLAHRRGKGI
jgi:glycosyltransferase involved in cell wall biosynthesis